MFCLHVHLCAVCILEWGLWKVMNHHVGTLYEQILGTMEPSLQPPFIVFIWSTR